MNDSSIFTRSIANYPFVLRGLIFSGALRNIYPNEIKDPVINQKKWSDQFRELAVKINDSNYFLNGLLHDSRIIEFHYSESVLSLVVDDFIFNDFMGVFLTKVSKPEIKPPDNGDVWFPVKVNFCKPTILNAFCLSAEITLIQNNNINTMLRDDVYEFLDDTTFVVRNDGLKVGLLLAGHTCDYFLDLACDNIIIEHEMYNNYYAFSGGCNRKVYEAILELRSKRSPDLCHEGYIDVLKRFEIISL